jgi:hypothetical protein
MIGTPSLSGDVWLDYHNSYIHSIVLAAQKGWTVQTNGMSGNSLIPYARAIIGQDFMDSDCDVLFFIDADLSWDPEGFVRILEAPLEIMGGAYPIKKDGDPEFHIKLNGPAPKSDKPILVETSAVGGGFIKITRRAMEKLQEAYPELKANYRGRDIHMLWDTMIVDGVPIGEDFSFCKRWKQIGGMIYVDPDIDFGHYGRKSWHGNFLRDAINKEKRDG